MTQSASLLRGFRAENKVARGLAFAGAMLLTAGLASATSTSVNTGSLGATANGTNASTVTFGPGAVAAGGDLAAIYNNTNGTNTTIPYLSALNPAASSPFTIEFWAKPATNDSDSAPVANRVSSGNRSGWVFFERGNDPANPSATPGWNFRMYNGSGSGIGWDLTGGPAPLNAWSQVVATWNGSSALLYVNGVLAAGTNASGDNGVYNPTTTAPLTVGTLEDQSSPFDGSVDEVAWYGTALNATQILAHYTAVSSPTPGTYQSLVRADGALLQLSNGSVPEPAVLLPLGGCLLLLRRRLAQ